MRVNEYAVFSRALAEGVERGWHRAHKHQDDPLPVAIMAEIEAAVDAAVCEYFVFTGLEEVT